MTEIMTIIRTVILIVLENIQVDGGTMVVMLPIQLVNIRPALKTITGSSAGTV